MVMADWLKVNHALVRSPKVRGLMRELKCKKVAALGVALSWLCWIDEQTKDGQTGLLPDELDDELGFGGCARALVAIGWAALGEDGCVYALEFGKHCGESAKERAENARRVAKCKANKKKVTEEVTENHYQGNEKTLPNALPEKNRIEENNKEEVQESYTTVDTSCGGGAQKRPDGVEEVELYMVNLPAGLGADPVELQTAAESFFNEMEAVGWVNAKGVPVRDWRAMARSYLMKWMRNLGSGVRGAGCRPVVRSERKRKYEL